MEIKEAGENDNLGITLPLNVQTTVIQALCNFNILTKVSLKSSSGKERNNCTR